MLNTLHAVRWTLGGTIAVVAGLAASAEPLAPLATEWLPEARADALTVSVAQPLAEPPMTPRARALGSIPVAVAVQSGAEIRPPSRPIFTAEARWDDHREGEVWSEAAMVAIEEAPRDLTEMVPADIGSWCPGYEKNPPHLRAAFWVGTVSALARYESTFNEGAVGGGGAWHGLLQISPATARGYGCEATSGEALRDGEANIECAIRIMSRTVTRDGVVAAGGGGIAADWGPMSREALREKIRDWVSGQSYCEPETAVMASLIPPVRPSQDAAEERYQLAGLATDP